MMLPRRTLALTLACAVGLACGAAGAAQIRKDPALLAAFKADPQLSACGCIVAAAWLDESYPRVSVDPVRWERLSGRQRARLSSRALAIAEATYLTESAATDQYEQIFFVDRRGKLLSSYQPTTR